MQQQQRDRAGVYRRQLKVCRVIWYCPDLLMKVQGWGLIGVRAARNALLGHGPPSCSSSSPRRDETSLITHHRYLRLPAIIVSTIVISTHATGPPGPRDTSQGTTRQPWLGHDESDTAAARVARRTDNTRRHHQSHPANVISDWQPRSLSASPPLSPLPSSRPLFPSYPVVLDSPSSTLLSHPISCLTTHFPFLRLSSATAPCPPQISSPPPPLSA